MKGAGTNELDIIDKGGILDDIWQKVSTSITLETGNTGFFILKDLTEYNEINDIQGKFTVSDGNGGFIEFRENLNVDLQSLSADDEKISDFFIGLLESRNKNIDDADKLNLKSARATYSIEELSPVVSTAGTKSLLSIYGSGFGETQQSGEVWFVNADSPGSIFTNSGFEIKLWSDTLIQVIIPSRVGTGNVRVKIGEEYAVSPQKLTIRYACLDSKNDPVFLINTNQNGGYTWRINTNIASNAQAEDAAKRAVNQWVCSTQVPWQVGETTNATSGMDGVCTISFGDAGNGLGVTTTFFQSFSSNSENTEWVLKEADIVLSDKRNWCYDRENILSSQYDFETVLLHELGHAHLIGHVNDAADLMHYGITAKSFRDINSTNIECGEYIIEKSLNYSSRHFKTIILPVLASVGDAEPINGSSMVCAGQNTVTYSVPKIENATSYTWTLPPGATGSSTTNSINVNFGTNATSGNITVRGSNACSSGASASKAIMVSALPQKPGTISGDSNVNAGQSTVIYSVPETENAESYSWTLPPGATGTSTTSSISVNFGANAKSGNITVKASNGCGNSSAVSKAIIVNSLPGKPGAIAGQSNVCAGQSVVTYSIPEIENATSYLWTLPPGATGTSTTNSIRVNFGANAKTGSISVKGSNSTGNGASVAKIITVSSLPEKPGAIIGEQVVCAGESVIIYSVSETENAESYSWTLPTGATGTSTTNSISVNFGANATSGNISVKAVNACGSSIAVSKEITVNTLPKSPAEITGEAVVCAGESAVIYAVPEIENAESYSWTLPPGVSGSSTTSSISVNFRANATSGNITVRASNPCGNGEESTMAVTVNEIPATPEISLIDNTLHSDFNSGNQWYFQGDLIAEATGDEFSVSKSGDYYVVVSLAGCRSEQSNTIHVVLTDADSFASSEKNVKIFPNPVEDELTLELKGNREKLDFEILNVLGQAIYKGVLMEQSVIKTAHFPPGYYFVKFKNCETCKSSKFVKQ